MTVVYRTISDPIELRQFADLQKAIWNMQDTDIVPGHMLHALIANGALLQAAFDGQNPVGMSLAFPVQNGSVRYLWSHMTGVHPAYQGRGIGTTLKQQQYAWAAEQRYTAIRWTFDPLQRGNAHFNMHILGATAQRYHVDYYGAMTDEINRGLPSDRLEAIWSVRRLHKHKAPAVNNCTPLLSFDSATHQLALHSLELDMRPCTVAIPQQLKILKQDNLHLAYQWRLMVREALLYAFENNYTITDFIGGDVNAYVLQAPQRWFMYVVVCQDGTLYTGISNDLRRRINQHNRGKGAAYTATRRPVKLIASWCYVDHSAALRAEAAFKKLPKARKLTVIQSQQPYQNGTFHISQL